MRRNTIVLIILSLAARVSAIDIWMDVDAALAEVPVNIMPLTDDSDFKSREESIVYNQAGLDLLWNFVTTAGAYTQTAVTPTEAAGDYDWTNQGNGYYTIEIPASGGASANNDTEGYGWFSGYATGVLPWRGPIIGFRDANLNNVLVDAAAAVDALPANISHVAGDAVTDNGDGLLEVNVEEVDDNATVPASMLEMFATDWATAYDGTANMLNVDIAAVGGATQSLTDLKDFVESFAH